MIYLSNFYPVKYEYLITPDLSGLISNKISNDKGK